MDATGSIAVGSCTLALVSSLALPVVSNRLRVPVAVAVAATLCVLTAAMLAYAFAGEGYTNDDRTVWEVANWARRLLLLAGITLAAGAKAIAAMGRRRRWLTLWVPTATVVVVLVNYLALASTVE